MSTFVEDTVQEIENNVRNERSIPFWRIFYLQKEEAFEELKEACLDRKSEVRERKIEKRMTERKVVVRIF